MKVTIVPVDSPEGLELTFFSATIDTESNSSSSHLICSLFFLLTSPISDVKSWLCSSAISMSLVVGRSLDSRVLLLRFFSEPEKSPAQLEAEERS